MALFDSSITIMASPDQVWEQVRRATGRRKVILAQTSHLLAVTDRRAGHVYLLAEEAPGQTRLRYLLARPETVVLALATVRPLEEALALLEQDAPDLTQRNAGHKELQNIKNEVEWWSTPTKFQIKNAVVEPQPMPQVEPLPPYGRPWNPMLIFWMSWIALSLVAGLALGFNWRRLGKPRWVPGAVLLAVLVQGSSVALILLSFDATVFAVEPTSILLRMSVYIGVGLNIGFILAVARLQHQAYRLLQDGGGYEAMYGHRYRFRSPLLAGAALFVVFVGLGMLRTMPIISWVTNFEGGGIALSYPGNTWAVVDISSIPDCRTGEYDCLLMLGRYPDGRAALTILRYPLTDTSLTVEALEARLPYDDDVESLSHDMRQIDDHPAVRHLVRWSDSQTASQTRYYIRYLVIDADHYFDIRATFESADVYRQLGSDLDTLISALHFTGETALTAP